MSVTHCGEHLIKDLGSLLKREIRVVFLYVLVQIHLCFQRYMAIQSFSTFMMKQSNDVGMPIQCLHYSNFALKSISILFVPELFYCDIPAGILLFVMGNDCEGTLTDGFYMNV